MAITRAPASRSTAVIAIVGRPSDRGFGAPTGARGGKQFQGEVVLRSAAGDEGDRHVGGVPIEVLASPVVHGGGSGVGVAGGHIDFSERYARVEAAIMNAARSMWGSAGAPAGALRPGEASRGHCEDAATGKIPGRHT
jgi:hypothetical protein